MPHYTRVVFQNHDSEGAGTASMLGRSKVHQSARELQSPPDKKHRSAHGFPV